MNAPSPINVCRKPRKPSLCQEDRLPVETYENAVWALVKARLDPDLTDHCFDHMVKLVADVFWQPDKRVRADVIIASREVGL